MKEQIRQPRSQESQAISSQPQAANQAPLSTVLQRYQMPVQRESAEEEEDVLQGKFAGVAQRQEPSPPLPNNTGLPDNLKSGIENLSGYGMNDVKVHYNSSKPAQLQALAYTQGTDIHVAPGQEKHLPHEAWHVVQQKQGRVQPTMQLKGVNVNDDEGLEREADRIFDDIGTKSEHHNQVAKSSNVVQRVIYLKKDDNFEENEDIAKIETQPIKKGMEMIEDEENEKGGITMIETKPLEKEGEMIKTEDEKDEDEIEKEEEEETMYEINNIIFTNNSSDTQKIKENINKKDVLYIFEHRNDFARYCTIKIGNERFTTNFMNVGHGNAAMQTERTADGPKNHLLIDLGKELYNILLHLLKKKMFLEHEQPIDEKMTDEEMAEKIMNIVKNKNLPPLPTLITHNHADHNLNYQSGYLQGIKLINILAKGRINAESVSSSSTTTSSTTTTTTTTTTSSSTTSSPPTSSSPAIPSLALRCHNILEINNLFSSPGNYLFSNGQHSAKDENENSLLFCKEYGDTIFINPGDLDVMQLKKQLLNYATKIGSNTEQAESQEDEKPEKGNGLTNTEQEKVRKFLEGKHVVLAVSHHGSKTGTDTELIYLLKDAASFIPVISAPRKPQSKEQEQTHPALEVIGYFGGIKYFWTGDIINSLEKEEKDGLGVGGIVVKASRTHKAPVVYTKIKKGCIQPVNSPRGRSSKKNPFKGDFDQKHEGFFFLSYLANIYYNSQEFPDIEASTIVSQIEKCGITLSFSDEEGLSIEERKVKKIRETIKDVFNPVEGEGGEEEMKMEKYRTQIIERFKDLNGKTMEKETRSSRKRKLTDEELAKKKMKTAK